MTGASSVACDHRDRRRAQILSMLCTPDAQFVRNGRTIAEVTTSRGAYISSSLVEDVLVNYADGSIEHFVLKDLSPHAVPPESRGVKPSFLSDPRREIETYQKVLGPFRVGAPEFIGAVVDDTAECYLLLLESRRQGVPLWQVGESNAWHEAARWLAALHLGFADIAPSLAGPARLLSYNARYYARWQARAEAAIATTSGGTDRRLIRAYQAIIPRLLALPKTLIHGEFHASNIMVESLPQLKVTPVDWEMAALAPGLMDLADLTAGKWTPGQRESLVCAYRDALATGGIPADPAFEHDLHCCRLHRALQWLSWSPKWTPPKDHAHDWVGEAFRACERLGLD